MKYKIGILALFLLVSVSLGQNVELIFSHQFHAVDVEAECSACHVAADTSTMAMHNLLPDMETCYTCHDEDTDCTVCHKDPDNAVPYPRIEQYIAKFPHATHVENEVACETCHAGVAASSNILDSHLPDMGACMNCHTELEQPDYCITCHAESEDLMPADHKLDWTKSHGFAAQADQECSICHTEDQCLDCHQGDNLDHKVHPLNFVNNHAIFAKGNKDNCLTCHEELLSCVDCHQQELVMPANHSSAGWSNFTTGGRHAREALQDLDSCVSCHNDAVGDPVCLTCHQQ